MSMWLSLVVEMDVNVDVDVVLPACPKGFSLALSSREKDRTQNTGHGSRQDILVSLVILLKVWTTA
ncbi:GL12514 [Drosophila persimilis]|uniref:GL12514 n=1 Tax=Drosophila persimilis TaxID=7234 RepID=B4GL73_DROPE|nr:GL12514 [Drosophila persimilis]